MSDRILMKDFFPRGNIVKIGVSNDKKSLSFSTNRFSEVPLCEDGQLAMIHAVNSHDDNIDRIEKLEMILQKYMKSISECEGVEHDYYINSIGTDVEFSEDEIALLNSLL